MIGNISHQWRLPLTRLQMMTQNMQMLQKDEKIQNLFLGVKEQIFFMNQTIDTFVNFYRSDKDNIKFIVSESILEVNKIISSTLKDKGILLDIKILDDYLLIGRRNELGQVILNIILPVKSSANKYPFLYSIMSFTLQI
jgi:signal transduction histidine kinase